MENSEKDQQNKALPPVGEHVIVQCRTFSCMGYVDSNGKWRDAYTDKELPEVINFNLLSE
jgi:hypothetical protein